MTFKNLYHWYHVYAAGDWVPIVDEHLWTLRTYGLYDNLEHMFIGFVGSSEQVAAAKAYIADKGIEFTACAEAAQGWEQVTQQHLWDFSQTNDGYCLYAHTKGAALPVPHLSDHWRRHMAWHTICQWRDVLQRLEDGARIAGCHWIDTPHYGIEHHHGHVLPSLGIFGGNFWWTRLEEIRTGHEVQLENRYCAEHWIGQRNPPLQISEVAILDGPGRGVGHYHPHEIDWYKP